MEPLQEGRCLGLVQPHFVAASQLEPPTVNTVLDGHDFLDRKDPSPDLHPGHGQVPSRKSLRLKRPPSARFQRLAEQQMFDVRQPGKSSPTRILELQARLDESPGAHQPCPEGAALFHSEMIRTSFVETSENVPPGAIRASAIALCPAIADSRTSAAARWNFACSVFTSRHSFFIRSESGSAFSHWPNSQRSSGRTFSTVHSLCPVLIASRSRNFHLACAAMAWASFAGSIMAS